MPGRLRTQAEADRARREAEEEAARRGAAAQPRNGSHLNVGVGLRLQQYQQPPTTLNLARKGTRAAVRGIFLAAGAAVALAAIGIAQPWKGVKEKEGEEVSQPTSQEKINSAAQNIGRALAVKSAVGTIIQEAMEAGRLLVPHDGGIDTESSPYFEQMHEAMRARLNYTFARQGLETKSIETLNPQPPHPNPGDTISIEYRVELQDQSTGEIVLFVNTVSLKFE